MSYNVYIEIDTGSPDGLTMVEEVGNYTSNVSGMWTHALTRTPLDELRGRQRLRDLKGVNCADAIPCLTRAVEHMTDHPEEYKSMEPDNGWGDYAGALAYLKALLDACRRHPKASIDVTY